MTRITDEAVEAMCDLTYHGRQITAPHARWLLEAVLPHLEGATPAIDREALEQLFEKHGVYETTYISTERVESSRRILAAAVLALIGGAR
jgi:hypothetical protein